MHHMKYNVSARKKYKNDSEVKTGPLFIEHSIFLYYIFSKNYKNGMATNAYNNYTSDDLKFYFKCSF